MTLWHNPSQTQAKVVPVFILI